MKISESKFFKDHVASTQNFSILCNSLSNDKITT